MKLTINTSEARQLRPDGCTRCKKKKRALFRHHMGNDAQLARFNRKIAEDYDKYLDCVYLCNRCHMLIHYIYLPIVQAWTNFSPKGVLRLREKLIDICKLWLAGSVADPDRATPQFKMFKDQWQRSYVMWRRSNPLPRRKKKGTSGRSGTSSVRT